MASERAWGAKTDDERWLAMSTLLAFASTDGSISKAERRIIAWAGRELSFDRLPGYDLALAARGIASPACRKELIRTIVLLLEAHGGSTAEDRAVLAYLTRAWDLPTPELAPPAAAGAPLDPEALVAARGRAVARRTEAVGVARSWQRMQWGAVVSMVTMIWGFTYLLPIGPLMAAGWLSPQGPGVFLPGVGDVARMALVMAVIVLPAFISGLVLGLRGAVEREARHGGFIAWVIPGAVAMIVTVATLGPSLAVAGWSALWVAVCFASAGAGHLGVRTTRRFRPDRPV